MVYSPLTNYWDYEPVIVRCPCGHEMPAEEASGHAFDHWDDLK